MTIDPKKINDFKTVFEANMTKIREFEGCKHLELLQEIDSNILMTYSYWQSQEALESYRYSDLFESVWKTVKPMFTAKTEAWSLDQIHKIS